MEYLSGEGPYANREQHPFPHLILLDLKLPRLSGFEVLAWLRQQSGLKPVPVIILTSSREASDVEKAYQLGVNSYLVKPTAFDQLLEMTERLEHFWLDLNQFPDIAVD
jgi:CheY-like chemotaxis protein